MTRRPSALATVALAAALASCRAPRTEIVLRVDTDMTQGPGATLTAVRVEVSRPLNGEQLTTFRRQFVLRGDPMSPFLPADMGILPRENDVTTPITVVVAAMQGDTELFSTSSTVTFERDRTTQLDVFLADRCREATSRMCPTGFTCGRSGCEPVTRPRLPTFEPPDGGASTDARPTDTGADTGVVELDATVGDTGVVIDTGIQEDAIVQGDTGVSMDTGISMDTGVLMDTGIRTDTGVPMDVRTDTGVGPSGNCGPFSFAPSGALGALTLGAGVSTLSTTTGQLTGATTMSYTPTEVDQGRVGTPRIAVFDFTSIVVPTGATLRIVGARVAALLSTGDVSILGTIDLNGGQGVSGMPNMPGAGGIGGAGGFSGGTISGGCASGSGNGQGPGRGGVGACGGTGGRGGDATGSAGAGGGGGGGGCGGGGGAGGSHATAGNPGSEGSAPSMTSGSVGTGSGAGAGGMSCSGTTPGGAMTGLAFDSSLFPIQGGSGGGCGGFGGFQGFGGRGAGTGGGAGGAGGFSGGGGGGGGGGSSAASVELRGQIRAAGGLGGAGSGIGVPAMGTSASFTGSAAFGGGGAGASGAGAGGGGGAGGAVFIVARSVDFTGTLDAAGGLGGGGFSVALSGAFGGTGRNGGSSGGRGGNNGTGGSGGDGGRGGIRVIAPVFNNSGVVRGMLRHDAM